MREHFPGAGGVAYLNTASQALGAEPVRAAYREALDAWVLGRFDFDDAERAGHEARALFARMLGADASEIALVPSVSAGAGTVAAQLGDARAGENVVVGAEEYTSNLFSWLLLADRGYEVRLVPFEHGAPTLDGFRERIDARTRLVAVSAV